MRIVTNAFVLLFASIASSLFAGQVDSIRTKVTPVQCFGLRNGVIHVDTVFGGAKPYYYSLDGEIFTTNPTFDHLWAGGYTVYVKDGSGGVKNWQVTVKEPAELKVRLVTSATAVVAGEDFILRAIPNVEREFLRSVEWQPSDLFAKQDTLKQSVKISEATVFGVTVEDYNHCRVSDNVKVEVEETHLYLPNVIKPGSPSDSYFTVFSGEGVRRVVSLQVYSRSGSLVFERLDFPPNAPMEGWSGRWDGKVAPAGVYAYLAVVEFWDGQKSRQEGTVTVVN